MGWRVWVILPQMSAGEGDLADLLSQDLHCGSPVGGWAPPATGRLEDRICLLPALSVCGAAASARPPQESLPCGLVGHEGPDSL